MKTKKSGDTTKRVQGTSVAKKVEAKSGKMKTKNAEVVVKKKAVKTGTVQNVDKNLKKTEMDSENRKLQNIIIMAENIGIDVVNLIKTELIRAIQRAEGSNQCYMSEEVLNCGQVNCLWREDCASF